EYDGIVDTTDTVRVLNTTDTYGLGGEFKLTDATALKAVWMALDSDADTADADMRVLSVEHKLDESVWVYGDYAVVDNDDGRSLTPWGQGRSATPSGAAGEKASALSVGLRYDF